METIRSGTIKAGSLLNKLNIRIAPGFFILILLVFISCKKDEVPVLTTAEVTSVDRTSAVSGGEVTYEGTYEVISKGVCWGTVENPTIMDSITVDGSGLGSFTSNLTGLDPETEYFVRAYATNNEGTGYGDTKSFITEPVSLPEIYTYSPYPIRCTSAQSSGEITCNGGSPVIDYGICWSKSRNPTLSDNFISADEGSYSFSIWITGLESNTDYYARAYATNSVGTGYGNIKEFKTCLDINSNPVDPVTITLWDKPLDTIRHYIQGKWRVVVIKEGHPGYLCVHNYFSEFTADNLFITNTFSENYDTCLIEWIKQSYINDSTYRLEFNSINNIVTTPSYIIKEIKYDSLIYHEVGEGGYYHFCIKEE